MSAYVTHRFFCMNCGKEGIPISRNRGRDRGKFHRKVLYCPNCKKTVNHIECRDDEEIVQFKNNFEQGIYINEVQESLKFMQTITF